jgi:hypothetical protein
MAPSTLVAIRSGASEGYSSRIRRPTSTMRSRSKGSRRIWAARELSNAGSSDLDEADAVDRGREVEEGLDPRAGGGGGHAEGLER